ncbi:TIGR03668 family PPOX class F420-dependent oxidoreductase [Cellulomonas timonensis]|uniref:TIGR03668 family PPOX class F420-dependent oxidoreductase n=1 Tax=Cellulomonas timonensis TaxID=1689271 RepID=UPI00082D3934|nr:TIGR03668 family PPOX class F420-dependent oxidoreductase [Cellulomonas timonensis]
MDPDECRRRFAAADHAYLATTGTDAMPHLVPVTHALVDDQVLLAVDHKPKRTPALRRLRNIAENPRVSLLVDHYRDDWELLWWVRADARAEVVTHGPAHDWVVAELSARYPQYQGRPPTGPAIVAHVDRWTGWSAA